MAQAGIVARAATVEIAARLRRQDQEAVAAAASNKVQAVAWAGSGKVVMVPPAQRHHWEVAEDRAEPVATAVPLALAAMAVFSVVVAEDQASPPMAGLARADAFVSYGPAASGFSRLPAQLMNKD